MLRLDSWLFRKHLEDDETVTKYVHKYWGVAVNALAFPTAFLLAGWAFLILAPAPTVLYATLLWSLFCAQWWLRNFLDYYLDVWIVTDQGIIALQWEGWFHRTASRILYSDIQGISYAIAGIMDTLNRVGTLTIEKISTGGNISLSDVRHPRRVEALILHNMEDYLHAKNLKNATHVQDLLSEFVAEKMQAQGLPKKAENKKGAAKKSIMVTRKV